MKLTLIKSNEPRDARMVSTRIEKTFQVNPIITVVADVYCNVHTTRYTKLKCIEVQDWETTYFIAGEKCKNSGVKELLNKLFTDLSHDVIEKSIREIVDDERNLVDDFQDFDTIQGVSEVEAKNLLEIALTQVDPTVNTNITFVHDWEIKTLAKLANDPRLQTVKVLTKYDQQRIANGMSTVPTKREVLVLNLG